MSKPKHTPGPWTIDFTTLSTGKAPSVEDIQGTFRIRECAAHEYAADDIGESTAIADANARLIAAAPELLEALQRISETDGASSMEMRMWAYNAYREATGGGVEE